MTYRSVTANARDIVVTVLGDRHRDRFHHRLMAVSTGLLGHPTVAFVDLYRFVECIGREIVRVPKSVRSFRVILPEEVMGRMTVVAGGNGFVTGLQPAAVLLVHDMAVRAGARVVAEIGISLRIHERVNPNARRKAHSDADNYQFQQPNIHGRNKFELLF